MKKNKILALILTSLLLISTGQISVKTAQAASDYKLIKQIKYEHPEAYRKVSSEKVIWNKEHTQKLGYLDNYPRTTWYVLSKITLENNNDPGDYYEIRSANKKHHGYVSVDSLAKKDNLPATVLYDSSQLWEEVESDVSEQLLRCVKRSDIDNANNQAVINLFPGVIKNNQVQLAADFASQDEGAARNNIRYKQDNPLAKNGLLGEQNLDQITSIVLKHQYIGRDDQLIDFLSQEINAKLMAMGKTVNDFAGYRIGVYVTPLDKNSVDKELYGQTYIYLVPPTVKLPKIAPVIYDPFSPDVVAHSTAQDNYKLNQKVEKLFPGTVAHKRPRLLAKLFGERFEDDDDYTDTVIGDIVGAKNVKKTKELAFDITTKKNKLSESEMLNLIKSYLVKELHFSKKTLNSFKGYYVGGSVNPVDYGSNGVNYIHGSVILVKPKAKFPRLGTYTFDLNKDDIF